MGAPCLPHLQKLFWKNRLASLMVQSLQDLSEAWELVCNSMAIAIKESLPQWKEAAMEVLVALPSPVVFRRAALKAVHPHSLRNRALTSGHRHGAARRWIRIGAAS